MGEWHNPKRGSLLAALVLTLSVIGIAQAAPQVPLEVYGRLPNLENVVISPDGSRVALVRTTENYRVLAIVSLADKKIVGKIFRLGTTKLRRLQWADDTHLLITTSVTAAPIGLMGARREWSMLMVLDVTTQKLRLYPDARQSPDVNLMNVTFSPPMIRHVDGHTIMFLPGIYVAHQTLPALFRIDLDTGTQRLIREGTEDTLKWLVDGAGEIAAEEDYSDKKQFWRVLERQDGRLREIASGREPLDIPELLGFGPEPDTLLMETTENGDPVWRTLSLKDGSFGPSMAERATLEEPIEDPETYRMMGGVHVDDTYHYVFFEPKKKAIWKATLQAFEGEKVDFVSAANDFRKIIVKVEGRDHGYAYFLVDIGTGTTGLIGDVYEGLFKPLEVEVIHYEAADGLDIPAYLTVPRDRELKNLPLIVLPHGGPAVRDMANFDYWAQALANQGYLVLQPNYRGSALSHKHLRAGYGEWGRKMQTDLSDGVRFLAKQGMADPTRVCIVGGSYGGYAALAGVTLDPGIYRCAVSDAGISDLKLMLRTVARNNWERTQRYWDRFMGVSGPSDPLLDTISPIKHLDALKVPVLLIHGKDDTVVNFEQSQVMYNAMKRANKDVELVTLENEDHWLSRSETRLQMLQATVKFLRAHNPPD